MLFGLFRRRGRDPVPATYVRLVDASRRPVFYAAYAVPDTVEGRFELIVLHCGLAVARLGRGTQEDRDAARRLSESFFDDMDRTLREMGIGDVSVPKKMKKIAEAFFGRMTVYEKALDGGDAGELALALARNVYEKPAPDGACLALAAHVAATRAALDAAPAEDILSGRFVWPEPATPPAA